MKEAGNSSKPMRDLVAKKRAEKRMETVHSKVKKKNLTKNPLSQKTMMMMTTIVKIQMRMAPRMDLKTEVLTGMRWKSVLMKRIRELLSGDKLINKIESQCHRKKEEDEILSE
jgi:pyruvate dehydrogenase complex dehydrogenase (E1) component